jgi:hypothetical protein
MSGRDFETMRAELLADLDFLERLPELFEETDESLRASLALAKDEEDRDDLQRLIRYHAERDVRLERMGFVSCFECELLERAAEVLRSHGRTSAAEQVADAASAWEDA